MRRGGTSRAWAGAFAAPFAAALLACPAVAGCGTADSGHASRATPTTGTATGIGTDRSDTASPAPHVTSDTELCTKLVGHGAREVLDGRAYGDYQSMGLSGGQYDILREVVDAARAARRQGTAGVGELIDRRAREGCAAWYRSGGPDEGPWR